MKNKDFQDEMLTLVERFWDERLPERSGGLYEIFNSEFDRAIGELIAEVEWREAREGFKRPKTGGAA